MNPFSNSFEKKWLAIILFMYFLIMIPLPCFFSTTYIPSFFNTPLFVWGWLAHGFIVMLLIVLWRHECLKRPEYHEYESED